MGLSDFLFGKGERFEQLPTQSPQQQQLLESLLGGLGGQGGPLAGGLQQLMQLLSGSPEATAAFERPLTRQFEEQTVPGIAERFTGAGAGAQRSSAFGQQLGAAGAGLSEQLGALRGGFQQQGLGQLSGLLGMGLGASPFENIFRPGTQGFLGGAASGLGQGVGQGIGSILPMLLGLL